MDNNIEVLVFIQKRIDYIANQLYINKDYGKGDAFNALDHLDAKLGTYTQIHRNLLSKHMDIKDQAKIYLANHVKGVYNTIFTIDLNKQSSLTPVQRYVAKQVIAKNHYNYGFISTALVRLRREAQNKDDYQANLNTLAYTYLIEQHK